MIVQVSWGSTARVWLDELPAWPSQDTEMVVEHVPAAPHADARPRSAAVEYVLPGPKARYGALGARFVPDRAGFLSIQVPHSSTVGSLVEGSLAGRLDTVYQGLASEYVDGVREGMLTGGAAEALGSGTLFVGWAAHGTIGSSPYDFAILARVLLHILVRMPTDEGELVMLIRAEITSASRRGHS